MTSLTTPHILPIQTSEGARAWVLGLEWGQVHDAEDAARARRARRIARSSRATHFVHSVSSIGVGYTRLLSPRRQRASTQHYSAAQSFAAQHSHGVAAAYLTLPGDPGHAWVAAAQDGVVIRGLDVVLPAAQATRAIQDVLGRYGAASTVHVLTDTPTALDNLGAHTTPFSWSELTLTESAALRPLGHQISARSITVAGGLMLLALALLYMAFAQRLRTVEPVPLPAPPPAAAQRDPVKAWGEALTQALEHTPVDTLDRLSRLAITVSDVPLRLAGWQLTRVTCAPQTDAWRCEATYAHDRPGAHLSQFHAPAGWTVDPKLTQLIGTWQMSPAPQAPLSQLTGIGLPELLSSLQQSLGAYRHVQVGDATPATLNIAAPVQPDGTAIPRPASLPWPHTREIRLSGPLRSVVYALPTLARARVRVDAFELQIGAEVTEPDLTTSAYAATLTGVVYVD